MSNIHATAIVHEQARLAPDVRVGPYCVIGESVSLGPGCVVEAHAVVTGCTTLGAKNVVHSHAVVGGPPQDLKYHQESTTLEVGDRNTFREGVTVNTGTIQGGGRTVIGNDNWLMANSHVAHDCVLGDGIIMANNVMLAGHVRVQDYAILNGGLGIHHFTSVGRFAYVGGLSRITRDVPPFMIVEGHPSRVRGVNVIGLRRAGFGEEAVAILKEAYKALFRSDMMQKDALERLERKYPDSEEIRELAAFIRATEGGRQGRQQEPPDRGLE